MINWIKDLWNRTKTQLGDFARHGFGSMIMVLLMAMFWRIFLSWQMSVFVAGTITFFFGLGYELGGNCSIRDIILNFIGIAIMMLMCGAFGYIIPPPVIF